MAIASAAGAPSAVSRPPCGTIASAAFARAATATSKSRPPASQKVLSCTSANAPTALAALAQAAALAARLQPTQPRNSADAMQCTLQTSSSTQPALRRVCAMAAAAPGSTAGRRAARAPSAVHTQEVSTTLQRMRSHQATYFLQDNQYCRISAAAAAAAQAATRPGLRVQGARAQATLPRQRRCGCGGLGGGAPWI